MEGKAQTVLGLVEPSSLGKTLTHEHLFIEFQCAYTDPPSSQIKKAKEIVNKQIELSNLGWIRYYPYSVPTNLQVDQLDIAIQEAQFFKDAGGQTIVDVTTNGIRIQRNPVLLQTIAERTGLNIIAGAGYYVGKTHPGDMSQRSEQQLCELIVKEITQGMDETPTKAGVIGEIGCSWPLQENEKKVLRAAATAQRITGAPLIIHPGRHEDSPLEIMNVLAEAGADIPRTVMSHLDRTVFHYDNLLKLADAFPGLYLEFDLFGTECSYYQLNEKVDMPSDGQRIDTIVKLVKDGLF